MRFGTIHMTTWPAGQTQQQVLQHFVNSVVRAEELGFCSSWTTEHHMGNDPTYKPYDVVDFDYQAYDLASNPLTLLAFAAAKTSRIRLGTGVLVAQYDHPIRIAEQAAMLDVLSNGRLELGIGRGGSQGPREPIIFNVPQDPALNQKRLMEVLEVIILAWTGKPFSYQGEFFQIPEGIIVPKLLQDPRDVMIVGSMTPEVVEWAARKGMAYCSSGLAWGYARLPAVVEVDKLHRKTAADAGVDLSSRPSPHVLTLYCGEDDIEADETAEQYLISFSEVIAGHSEKERPNIVAPGTTPDPAAKMDGLRAVARHVIETQIVGSPRTCIEKLEAFKERSGIDLEYVLVLVDFGGIPPHKSIPSMERFAEHVMPHFTGRVAALAL